MKLVRRLLNFFRRIIWVKPNPTAKDVIDQWITIKYKKQFISLRRSEAEAWNKMSRKDKRAMAKRFKILEKKGQIKFTKVKGKTICVKTKSYEGSNRV
ncbi:MAG: hypothetical protein PF440_00205 [Thiomicrorhabdus sp.]|jgi:hypothetical protein|nr:hypothetical protein [Thiomicrorhabdus sp.]